MTTDEAIALMPEGVTWSVEIWPELEGDERFMSDVYTDFDDGIWTGWGATPADALMDALRRMNEAKK
jgi:hypothetical protein